MRVGINAVCPRAAGVSVGYCRLDMDKVQVFDIYGRAGFVRFQLRHIVAYGFHGAASFLWSVFIGHLFDKSIPSLVSDCILSVAVRAFNPAACPVSRVSV